MSSKTVDDRIVSLEFDNKRFESNVNTTIGTLDKLKSKLNFQGVEKSFEGIDKAAKKVNLSSIADAVSDLQHRFSAFAGAGVRALTRIADQAVNTGIAIGKMVTIDPVKSGLSEYETQIGAIQTILSNTRSKGSTLNDVNAALDELNTYADQTIYNFTQMTKNIGTFTAAGVDLETATSSIKGIANLAAVSGSTSQQASTAMYQLSQALAAGRVSLMDWNSVVNAGMGGELFQNALKRTAEHMGTNVDAMIEKYGSFRESLTRGQWLTTEVLTETLTQLSGAYTEADLLAQGYTKAQAKEIVDLANDAVSAATDVKTFTQLIDTTKEALQSGWTNTWEIIIGDFQEAKDLWSGVSAALNDAISSSADARNKFLQGGLSSGYKQLLSEGITDEGLFSETLQKVAKDNGVAIDDLISKAGNLEKSFKEGWLTSDMLTESLNKYADTILNMSAEERKANKYTQDTINAVTELKKKLDDGTLSADEFIKKINQPSGRENIIQGLTNALNFLNQIIQPIKEAFAEIFPAMTSDQLYELTERFVSFTEKLTLSENAINGIRDTFKGLFSVVSIGVDFVSALGKAVWTVITTIFSFTDGITSAAGSFGNFLSNIRTTIKESGVFENVLGGIANLLSTIITKVADFANALIKALAGTGGIWPGISSVIDSVFKGFNSLNAENAIGIASTGIFGGLLLSLKNFVDSSGGIFEAFKESASNFSAIFGEVKNTLQAFQADLKANVLTKIATAIAILAGSLLVLSLIDTDSMAKALAGLTVIFAELIGGLALFNKLSMSGKGMIKVVPLMIGLSSAILILAAALKVISTVDSESIITGLVAIGALFTELSLFLRNTDFSKTTLRSSAGIVLLSSALLILIQAVKQLGLMSNGDIVKGLAGIGILLTELSVFNKISSGSKGIFSISAGMILLGTSMVILVKALQGFSTMSWPDLSKGLQGMALALTAIVTALNLMPKNTLVIGAGLIFVGTALKIISESVESLGYISWDSLVKGLTAIGGVLVELSIALNLMKGTLSGSAALLVASSAILVLTPALQGLGKMSLGQIVASLLALAGAFTVMGVAGALLGGLTPAILALSGALALLGIGIAGIGGGLLMLAAGFAAIAAGGVAMASSVISSLQIIITGLIGFIPLIATEIAKGLVNIVTVLADSAGTIAESLLKTLMEILKAFAGYSPQIVEYLFDFLISVLNALAEKLPELVKAAMNLIGAFFQGIIDALSDVDSKALMETILSIGLLAAILAGMSALAGLVPGAMLGILGFGALITELTAVLAAVGAIAQIPGLDWLVKEGGSFLKTIGNAIGGFFGSIVGGFVGGISDSFPTIATNLSTFMTNLKPFIDGAKDLTPDLLSNIQSLADSILTLTASSFLDAIASFITGGSSLASFSEQLVPFGKNLKAYGAAVSGMDQESIQASAIAVEALATLSDSLPKYGGFVQWIMGQSDLEKFGEQLEPFGNSLALYGNAVSGMKSEAIQASATAVESLAQLNSSLPSIGGVIGFFTGEQDLTLFGQELEAFGSSLVKYSNTITEGDGINPEAIQASGTAAQTLATLQDNLPSIGGVIGFFAGNKESLSTFGDDLAIFGAGLRAYSDSITAGDGISSDAITASATASEALVALANNLPNSGGLWGWLSGNKTTLETFGEDIAPLGKGLSSFSNSITNVDPTKITNAAMAMNRLVDVIADMDDISTDGVNNFTTALSNLETIGSETVTKFINGIDSKRVDVKAKFESMITDCIKAVDERGKSFKSSGLTNINSYLNGIKENVESSSFTSTCNSIVNKIVSIVKSDDNYTKMYNAGSYFVDGLVSGINQNSYKGRQAGYSLGIAVVNGAMAGLDEHSPSKVGFEIGDNFGMPVVDGVLSWLDRAEQAGANLGTRTVDGLNSTINKVNSKFNFNIDTEPTIRPVVDLSNIRSGSDAINSMFSNLNPSLGLVADIGQISNSFNQNQNGRNSDILSALNSLGKILSNSPRGDSYNINGITYSGDSDVATAIRTLVRAAKIDGRS